MLTHIIEATIGHIKHRYEPRKVMNEDAEFVSFQGTNQVRSLVSQ